MEVGRTHETTGKLEQKPVGLGMHVLHSVSLTKHVGALCKVKDSGGMKDPVSAPHWPAVSWGTRPLSGQEGCASPCGLPAPSQAWQLPNEADGLFNADWLTAIEGGCGVTVKFRVSIRCREWEARVSLCRSRDQAGEFGGFVPASEKLTTAFIPRLHRCEYCGRDLVGASDVIHGPVGGHLSTRLPLSCGPKKRPIPANSAQLALERNSNSEFYSCDQS